MPDAPPQRPDASALADLGDPAAQAYARGLLATLTDALVRDSGRLDDDAVRRPSRCDGWSRAYVLTHLARNADAMVNLVTSATSGEATPMYASPEARDRDIQAGADRPAAELTADLAAGAERFAVALANLHADRLAVEVEGRGGAVLPAHDLVWMRLREVAYHHVDLDLGAGFGTLPPALVGRGLGECGPRLTAAGAPAMSCEVSDGSPDVRLDVGGGGRTVVSGTAAVLLGWATGRTAGTGLEVVTATGAARGQDATLPQLPSWG